MSFWQTMKGKSEKRKVVTAEQMGTIFSIATHQNAKDLMDGFKKIGVTANLSDQQYGRLGLEIVAFNVVCGTFSIMQTCREKGQKVGPFFARATLTDLAGGNLKSDDVFEFVEAGLEVIGSHYQFYSTDIWNVLTTRNKEELRKKTWPLGMKILRKILHPVI